MMVDSQGIIRVPRKTKKKQGFAGNLRCERAYAASTDVRSWPSVTATDTTKELRIQRPRCFSFEKAWANTLKSSLLTSGINVGAMVAPCTASENAKSNGKSTTHEASTSKKYVPAFLASGRAW